MSGFPSRVASLEASCSLVAPVWAHWSGGLADSVRSWRAARAANVVGSCGLGAPPLLLLLLGALQRDHAGADELDDPERLHLADERLELALVAGDLEDERLPGDVDDPGPEVLGDLPNLDPVVGRAYCDLDEHQLAADVVRAGVVDDREHVDELLELLRHLLHGGVLARDDERGARQAGALGLGHRQRLDVVAAPREAPGGAQERARRRGRGGGEHGARGAHEPAPASADVAPVTPSPLPAPGWVRRARAPGRR